MQAKPKSVINQYAPLVTTPTRKKHITKYSAKQNQIQLVKTITGIISHPINEITKLEYPQFPKDLWLISHTIEILITPMTMNTPSAPML